MLPLIPQSKKMFPSTKKPKTHNDIFFLQKGELIVVNDSMIDGQPIDTVKNILSNIRKNIIVLENSNTEKKENETMTQIHVADDVVYKFVKINRWRRGTGFLCLQISSNKESRIPTKPIGCARLCCFTTNTIHHPAFSFGTTPGVDEAKQMIMDYIESEQIIDDLNELKLSHPTKLSAKTLLKYIKY